MSGIKTLAGDTIIYGLSTFLTRMLNYLLTPYFTRIMATGEYGVVTDLYSLIPFALVLLTMGLERGYFRFAGKAAGEDEKRTVFATAWGATIVAAVVFGILAWLFQAPIASVLGYADRPSFIWLTAAIIVLDICSSMPFARLREQRRSMRYVGVRLASVVVNLLLCLAFYSVLPRLAADGGGPAVVWNPGFGAGYVLVANVAASVVALVLLLPTVRGIFPRIEPKVFRQIMLYSLPLLISGIAGTGSEFIDRQMIKWLLPEDIAMGTLGVYGATTKLAVIMVLFTTMYQLAAEPFFLARFRHEDFVKQNAEAMKYYVVVAVAIFLGIMFFEDVAVLILGERFRGGSHLLPVMLAANALAGVVLNLSFWYKQTGRTWIAVLVTGTGLVVALVLNIALIPRIGYQGAAWARLVCEGAMVGVSLCLNQKFCRTPYDFRRMGLYLLIGGALYAASFGTAHLPLWLMYSLNSLMLLAFAGFAVWKEKLLKLVKI